ncbi:MAG: HPr family phosphocarrier protein [Phycisphaerales bacterium]|nr:HPr family phosphocarrier protein [Phycisphaerae bacterium]
MSERASASVTIVNRLGLHARPAMCFVDAAMAHACAITVKRGDQAVDGKSIMMMMLLAATQGTELEIIAEGPGAQAAIDDLVKLVASGFGED